MSDAALHVRLQYRRCMRRVEQSSEHPSLASKTSILVWLLLIGHDPIRLGSKLRIHCICRRCSSWPGPKYVSNLPALWIIFTAYRYSGSVNPLLHNSAYICPTTGYYHNLASRIYYLLTLNFKFHHIQSTTAWVCFVWHLTDLALITYQAILSLAFEIHLPDNTFSYAAMILENATAKLTSSQSIGLMLRPEFTLLML
jgi:hypothetical protein